MSSKINMMTSVKLAAFAAVAGLAMAAGLLPASRPGSVGGAPDLRSAQGRCTPNLTRQVDQRHPDGRPEDLRRAGAAPPLNAAGKALYAKHKANGAAGKDDPINNCFMQGEPRLLFTKYPFLIMQYGKHVDFLHQANHTFRISYRRRKAGCGRRPDLAWPHHCQVAGQDPGDRQPTNYNAETWLDYSGLPHGEKLVTEERYTLGADGKTISGNGQDHRPRVLFEALDRTLHPEEGAGLLARAIRLHGRSPR